MSGALAVVGISTVVRPHDIPKVCERNLSEIVYRHPAELDNAEREATASPVASSTINGTLSWKTVTSISPTFSPSSASPLPVVTTMDGAHVAQLVVNFLALIVFMVGYAIGFGPSKQEKNPISSHRSDNLSMHWLISLLFAWIFNFVIFSRCSDIFSVEWALPGRSEGSSHVFLQFRRLVPEPYPLAHVSPRAERVHARRLISHFLPAQLIQCFVHFPGSPRDGGQESRKNILRIALCVSFCLL